MNDAPNWELWSKERQHEHLMGKDYMANLVDTVTTRNFVPATCSAQIEHATGLYTHRCNKPAKWLIENAPRCGRHALGRYWKKIRVPLPTPPNQRRHGVTPPGARRAGK